VLEIELQSIKGQPEMILNSLIEDGNILQEQSPNQIAFTFQSFQEYFAAVAIVDIDDNTILTGRATDRMWREIIIFAAGLETRTRRNELIMRLLELGDQDLENRRFLYVLAAACLSEADTSKKGIQNKVEQCLALVGRPTNSEEARELASVGELALPSLVYEPGLTTEEAILSIETLALMGTPLAHDTLQSYANEVRQPIVAAFLNAKVMGS